MEQLPVFLNLRGWPCLVVGAGPVGAGKAEVLAAAGGRVCIVAPEVCDSAAELAHGGLVELRRGRFERSDLEGRRLVVAATDDRDLNRRIVERAEARGVLANSASDARSGHFSMPAIVDRSPVLAAVSTGGASPSLARYVRAPARDPHSAVLRAARGACAGGAAGGQCPASPDLRPAGVLGPGVRRADRGDGVRGPPRRCARRARGRARGGGRGW